MYLIRMNFLKYESNSAHKTCHQLFLVDVLGVTGLKSKERSLSIIHKDQSQISFLFPLLYHLMHHRRDDDTCGNTADWLLCCKGKTTRVHEVTLVPVALRVSEPRQQVDGAAAAAAIWRKLTSST